MGTAVMEIIVTAVMHLHYLGGSIKVVIKLTMLESLV